MDSKYYVLFFIILFSPLEIAYGDTSNDTLDEDNPLKVSPTSVPSDLRYDDLPKDPTFEIEGVQRYFEPWDQFKQNLIDLHGFDLGIDYAALYQYADTSLTNKNEASSGVFRLYSKWELVNRGERDTGSLIFKVENRSRLNSVSPSDFGSEIGYAGVTGTSFNNSGFFVGTVYWEQFFDNQSKGFVVGRLDPFVYTDVSSYANEWRTFQNLSILGNSTIPVPGIGIGLVGGFNIGNQWLLGASAHDANGSQTEYEIFEDGVELFKQAFIAWSPTRPERYDKEIRFTTWHTDERDDRNIDSDFGVALSANWDFVDHWMIFTRLGWADGKATRADSAFVLGILHKPSHTSNQAGIAYSWENLSNDELDNQKVIEAFYNWQVFDRVEITPSVQLLLDPALNDEDSSVYVIGTRVRVTF